jgi:hypothetical protein
MSHAKVALPCSSGKADLKVQEALRGEPHAEDFQKRTTVTTGHSMTVAQAGAVAFCSS